jgi:hypothetical protein
MFKNRFEKKNNFSKKNKRGDPYKKINNCLKGVLNQFDAVFEEKF